jgi:hypothetical protein
LYSSFFPFKHVFVKQATVLPPLQKEGLTQHVPEALVGLSSGFLNIQIDQAAGRPHLHRGNPPMQALRHGTLEIQAHE